MDSSSRYDYFISRMDRNGDGQVDPNELEGPARGMFEGMAQRAGLDPSKPIKVEKIREAMIRRSQEREAERSGTSDKKDDKVNEDPLVPGFGVAQELPSVPGFGVRITSSSSTAPGGTTQKKSSGSTSSVSEKSRTEYKVREYAKGIVKKYDRDRSGSLEKDEWGHLKTDPKAADRNNDGVITAEELAVRFLNERKPGGSSGGSFGSHYRPRSPTEKLPDGLPEWFRTKDVNQDGQVAMHEYASSWSDSTAWEFTWNDLNNDGVITPSECLEAMTRTPEPEAVAVAVSARSASSNPMPAAQPAAEAKEEESKKDDDGGGFWWQQ